MWNRIKKTARRGPPMNQNQRQAWIENWTIWALQGMIGQLENILHQGRSNKVHAEDTLFSLIRIMKVTLQNIKQNQRDRKAAKSCVSS